MSSTSTTVSVVVVGTIVSYLSAPAIFRAFRYLSELVFGASSRQGNVENGYLKVFVKTTDKVVPVQLSPEWPIQQVKRHLARILGKEADELRIIVAGHDLRDDVIVRDCDLGQSTVIHAVKVLHWPTTALPSTENVKVQQETFENDLNETTQGGSFPEDAVDTTAEHNVNSGESNTEGEAPIGNHPMNACLLDLQLTSEERKEEEESAILPASSISSANEVEQVKGRIMDENTSTENEPNVMQQRPKAHFWVYCSEFHCGRTIQPGKIRVRCETCQEGAIIVISDPCSWDDVLNPRRIQGYCQNVHCPGIDGGVSTSEGEGARLRFVQFYFKCSGANHYLNYHESRATSNSASISELISSSEAPPLHLIRSNLKNVPCLGEFKHGVVTGKYRFYLNLKVTINNAVFSLCVQHVVTSKLILFWCLDVLIIM